MHSVDTAVVGAGVIGLAVARALAMAGREVVVFEAADDFGTGVSSRNSEVIHAGIYYAQNSLRARLCVSGRDRLYDFCERFGIEHRRCGKLIVATSKAQIADLQKIQASAAANGVELTMIERAEACALEPQLACEGALHSRLTGIIDARAYMTALLGQAESAGAMIAYRTRVTSGCIEEAGVALAVNDEREPSVRAKLFVNCAGLAAPKVAASLDNFPKTYVPRAFFAKGNYFSLQGRSPFSRLIYPIPEPGGLGIHLTLDMGGQARFGPDVEWLKDASADFDYNVDPARGEKFYAAIRTYWPALQNGSLIPAYSGIRPKISGPTGPQADFRIDGPELHGVPGVIHLFGIESPGLTSSLAIAEEVLKKCNMY